MNKILRHIEYMVSRRDCVIIPGFGAVLASWCSSRYDAEKELLMPPHREFSFNPELRASDGLLAASISRADGISYDSAVRIIKDDVESMIQQLRSYGDVPLGKVGVLHYSSESGIITFTPFDADRLSPSTSWLRPLSVREARAEGRQIRTEQASPVRFSPVKRAWRVAASIAVLLGISLVASTPISVPGDVTYASLAPQIEQVTPEFPAEQIQIPEAQPLTMEKSHGKDLWIDVPVTPKHDLSGKYCVIVSSHASLAEAQRYISRYSEMEMGILEKDGRYRVLAASAPTIADAEQARDALSATFTSAWVCRR